MPPPWRVGWGASIYEEAMPHIQMDEFHLTVSAPGELRTAAYRALRRTLDDDHFRSALRRAIRSFLARYPSLSKARITLTR